MTEINRLIANLLKYSNRPEWRGLVGEVWDEHLAMAAHHLDMAPEDLEDFLERHGLQDSLFGMVFEDFATRTLTDGTSFTRTYLRRAAWREGNRARKYLAAMADSRLSLYEVVEVRLDQGLMLRDLIYGEEPLFAREKSATRYLAKWDVVAARVVSVLGEQMLTGGILRLERREGDALRKALEKVRQSADTDGTESKDIMDIAAEQMPCLATTFWLVQETARLSRPMPEISNTDGEPLLFGEARVPLRVSASDFSAKLDSAGDWQRAADEPPVWNWSGGAPPAVPRPQIGNTFDTSDEAGQTLRGTLELKGDHVVFTANSRERVERGLHRLQELFGADLGTPLTGYTTLESAIADRKNMQEEVPMPDIAPEEIARIKYDYLDCHYRQVLDQPIPALGGKTPRQARRTKAGKIKVIEWLKYLENGESRRASSQGEEPYDFTWMWQALGLLEERDK